MIRDVDYSPIVVVVVVGVQTSRCRLVPLSNSSLSFVVSLFCYSLHFFFLNAKIGLSFSRTHVIFVFLK